MHKVIEKLRYFLEEDALPFAAAPPFYLTDLLAYLPVEPLSCLVPHLTPETDFSKAVFYCRRKQHTSLGALSKGQGFEQVTWNNNAPLDPSMYFHVQPPELIVSWGPVPKFRYLLDYVPVIRFDKLATTIWSERFGRLSFRRLEREILDAPGGYKFEGPQAHRAVLISCGLLVQLAFAGQVPSRFSHPDDIAGLGLMSKDPRLAAECLERVGGRVGQDREDKLVRHLGHLATVRNEPQFSPAPADPSRMVDEVARRALQVTRAEESAAQGNRILRGLYPLGRLQQLYFKRDRTPLHRGIVAGRQQQMKVQWGLPSRMRPEHYTAVIEAEGVTEEVMELWDRLTIGDEHARYSKSFLYKDTSAIPKWWHDGRYKPHLDLQDLLNHLLHRGTWVGYRPDIKSGPFGKITRILVVDLDVHGPERLGLEERYAVFREHLPGGMVFRSSWSGGLHIWFFLPKAISVPQLVGRVVERLGEDALLLGPRRISKNGWELKPDLVGNTNIRLFGGLGSVPLRDNLQPLDLDLAGVVDHVLRRARKQETLLQYLMQPPKIEPSQSRPPQEPHVVAMQPLHEHRRSTTKLDELLTPQLIRDGDGGTWNILSKIVGRALWAMGDQVKDVEEAWDVMQRWLLAPINVHRSKNLCSPNLQIVENRLTAYRFWLDRLWPEYEPGLIGGHRVGRSLQEEEVTEADRQATDSLAMLFARAMNLSQGDTRLDTVREAILDLARTAKRAKPLEDGSLIVWAGKQFWIAPPHGRWKLSTCPTLKKKIVGKVKNPLYYPNVVQFLIGEGVLTRLERISDRATTRYLLVWPPPDSPPPEPINADAGG